MRGQNLLLDPQGYEKRISLEKQMNFKYNKVKHSADLRFCLEVQWKYLVVVGCLG